MPKIVIIEDVKSQALKMQSTLRLGGFSEADWPISIWHIENPDHYGERLAETRDTDAEVLIADLGLIAPDGPDSQAILQIAERYAKTYGFEDDRDVWDWSDPDKYIYLPGLVLIRAFIAARPLLRHICVASTFADAIRDWLERQPALPFARGKLSIQVVRNELAQHLNRSFGHWTAKIWNEDTQRWFEKGNTLLVMDHDALPTTDPRYRDQLNGIRNLLRSLLGIEPPARWFAKDQFPHLYKSLQGLTGCHSCCNGSLPDRNLYISNLPILLGIAMQVYEAPAASRSKLMNAINWTKSSARLLPSQKKETARCSVRAIVDSVFGQLIWKDGRTDQDEDCMLSDVNLTQNCFELTLDFDCHALGERGSFVERALKLDRGTPHYILTTHGARQDLNVDDPADNDTLNCEAKSVMQIKRLPDSRTMLRFVGING